MTLTTCTDAELLEQYRRGCSSAAEELVRRHGQWVYCVARRRVGDDEMAHDIAQATFMVLARKQPRLGAGRPLSAWLFRVVNLASMQALRNESRRRRRETEAAKMRHQIDTGAADDPWSEVAPLLDEFVGRLHGSDRHAVLLRYFEQKSLAEVGSALGISEDAARKRVSRATEKLRGMFVARGVVVSSAALPAVLLSHTSNAQGVALSAVAAVSSESFTLAKGVITMMSWMKFKLAATTGVVLLVLAGGGAAVLTTATSQGSPATSGDGVSVRLTLQPTGMMKMIGYYVPQERVLSEARPASIKKAPADLSKPLYGTLPLAGPAGAIYHVILDEPDDKAARLFIDTNGNGDLTDDPQTTWAGRPLKWQVDGLNVDVQRPDGTPSQIWEGGATVDLTDPGGPPYVAQLQLYRFDPQSPHHQHLTHTLLYYRDFATAGEVEVGGKKYRVMLSAENANFDFSGPPDPRNSAGGVHLLIDRNGNGRFRDTGENVDVHRPFKIDGTVYELADIAKNGLSFRIFKSDKVMPDIPQVPPPEALVGQPAITFAAETMEGKAIQFPADYKGKLVLLDFWATWCGPCIAEAPTVVACHQKFQASGFEILGVSLDNPDAQAMIKTVCANTKMTWPQVYDGGGWKSRVATMYHIQSIPCAILVDGDSGKVLAAGDQLRGGKLANAVEKALAEKRAK